MHIKPGTWEATNAVCESDPLCDPAVLVLPPKPEPHIRNRRLSPGSGGCGGGGGGCAAGVDKLPHCQTPSGSLDIGVQAPVVDRERRTQFRGRGPRREGANPAARGEKPFRSVPVHVQKDRWVGETLTSLRPPPAFPVKDSPAKLQPAVSYASKVKAGGASGSVAEEPPGIRMLLQNQWGLSFISDGPTAESAAVTGPQDAPEGSLTATLHPVAGDVSVGEPAPSETSPGQRSKEYACFVELPSHLVEPVQYHTQEWSAILWKQKEDPAKVVWYQDAS